MLLDLPPPVLAEVLHRWLSHLESQSVNCALRCISRAGCALGSGECLLSAAVRRWPLAYASAMAELAHGTVESYFAELSRGNIEAFLRGAAADLGPADCVAFDDSCTRCDEGALGRQRWWRFSSLERARRQANRLAVKALDTVGWAGADVNSQVCSNAVRVSTLHATRLDCFTDSSDVFASVCAVHGKSGHSPIDLLSHLPACGLLALALARSCMIGSWVRPVTSTTATMAAVTNVAAEGQDKVVGMDALQRHVRLMAAQRLANVGPITIVLTLYEWGRLEGNYGNRFQYRTRDTPSCVRIGLESYVNLVSRKCDEGADGDLVSADAENATFVEFTHALEVRARKAAPSNVRSARLHLEVL